MKHSEHTVERLKRGILAYIGVDYGKSDSDLEYPRHFYTYSEKYPERQLRSDEVESIARLLAGNEDAIGNHEDWDGLNQPSLFERIREELDIPSRRRGSKYALNRFELEQVLEQLEEEYGTQHDLNEITDE